MQRVLRLGLWGNKEKLGMVACTCSRNLHRLSFPQVKVQGSHLEVRSLRAELLASHKTWELRTAGLVWAVLPWELRVAWALLESVAWAWLAWELRVAWALLAWELRVAWALLARELAHQAWKASNH